MSKRYTTNPTKHKARKRFGQNFLTDQKIIDQIIATIAPKRDDNLLEIGPGQGAMTLPLLDRVDELNVIEIDRDLIDILNSHKKPNLTIHQGDALNFDLDDFNPPIRVVGNLPYNISSPILFHLLEHRDKVIDMTFMLQKEVVDRICAGPGSKKYGRLSIMMQYYCATEHLFDVPPESFNPAPQVMSSIVRLVPHEQPPVVVDSVKMLNTVVTTAFSQRRKTLRNSLKKLITEFDITALDIDPTLRAETISLQDFAKLSQFIQQHPLDE